MQMNFQTLHHLYSERLPEIENIIDMESHEDADLRQEGLFGAYQALQTDPHATKRFLLNKAQWEMVSSLRKGKSVDNGFYKRKSLKIIHYDHLPFEDGIFAEAVSSDGKDPVDEQAIFRIDLSRFLEKLSHNERLFIQAKAMDGLSDVRVQKRLGITYDTLKAMKVNIRKQIQLSFA
jgi:DNA-directed RNA polymerase specialized sigma24 family protein